MKKYTKKLIKEAISYWNKILESKSIEKSDKQLISLAKNLGIDTSMIKTSSNVEEDEFEINESTASGFAIGVIAAMLGVCSIGKIANSLDGKFAELAENGRFAKQMESLDKYCKEVHEGLGKIEDALYAISKQVDFNDPSIEDIVLPSAAEQIDAEFEKIMALK